MTTESLRAASTTSNPGTHLASVKDLLAELDKMKDKGIGAQERLEYIIEGGTNLIDQFDFVDAFDLEHRAMSKRLKALDNMSSTLLQHQTQWASAPVDENVQQAATKLLDHLEDFIKTAQGKERKAEIEMLAQLWEWGPDLSDMYPWLRSGRPRPFVAPSEEVREFEKKKAALYEEVKEEAEAHPHHEPVPGPRDIEDHHDDVADRFVEQNPGASLDEFQEDLEVNKEVDAVVDELAVPDVEEDNFEEKMDAAIEQAEKPSGKDFPLVAEVRPGAPLERVVAKMSDPLPKPPAKSWTVSQDDDSQLRNAAWTEALREMTARQWRFVKEVRGHVGYTAQVGTVLLWQANGCEARLELVTEGSNTEVGLRLLLDGRLRRMKTNLSSDELETLHLDPLPFVKKTLEG